MAQAFSTRVARLKRRSGEACSTSEAVKSCAEKPALKWPSTISSTSSAAMPASPSASRVTRTIRLSTVSPASLPKGVCAQPTMQAVMFAPLLRAVAEFWSLFRRLKPVGANPHGGAMIPVFAFAFERGFGLDSCASALSEPFVNLARPLGPDQPDRTATRVSVEIIVGRCRLPSPSVRSSPASLTSTCRARGSAAAGRSRYRQGAARRERHLSVVSGLGHQADDHLRHAAGDQGTVASRSTRCSRSRAMRWRSRRPRWDSRSARRSPSTTPSRC